MNTRDLDNIEFRDEFMNHRFRHVGESDSAWSPYGRVLAWCRYMGPFRKYGEWTVQETNSAAACRGTVRARLSGPKGTVEAWNQHDVFFVPKGVKFSKAGWPECKAEDERNGIVFWQEPPFEGGRYSDHAVEVRRHFEDAIAEACAMAGIQERLI